MTIDKCLCKQPHRPVSSSALRHCVNWPVATLTALAPVSLWALEPQPFDLGAAAPKLVMALPWPWHSTLPWPWRPSTQAGHGAGNGAGHGAGNGALPCCIVLLQPR